jgi:hypothetical protein
MQKALFATHPQPALQTFNSRQAEEKCENIAGVGLKGGRFASNKSSHSLGTTTNMKTLSFKKTSSHASSKYRYDKKCSMIYERNTSQKIRIQV